MNIANGTQYRPAIEANIGRTTEQMLGRPGANLTAVRDCMIRPGDLRTFPGLIDTRLPQPPLGLPVPGNDQNALIAIIDKLIGL
ncbi:MAG: hypothetical protein ACOYN0_18490, partial [Phycisphaerales bacterium]